MNIMAKVKKSHQASLCDEFVMKSSDHLPTALPNKQTTGVMDFFLTVAEIIAHHTKIYAKHKAKRLGIYPNRFLWQMPSIYLA